MKRINPFVEIYRQCNASSNLEKYIALKDNVKIAPKYLDVELTNCCNIYCNMCPVGIGVMKRHKGVMSDEVFGRILDNVKKYHIQGIRFIRWGEPTLHPQFIEWGGVVKQEGALVHFNTNGLLLTEKMAQQIIDTEIDSMKFSFQGINDLTYEEMRNGGSYTQLLDNIKMIYNLRGDKLAPYISVTTTTTYESEEEIGHFCNEISPYCDEVGVGKTKMYLVDVDRMNLSEERSKIYEKFIKNYNVKMQRMAVCPEIWDKLSINWDGSVTACCSDYDNMMIVGNILDNDLLEIFHGDKIRSYREILKDNVFEQINLCSNCYEYIPLKK